MKKYRRVLRQKMTPAEVALWLLIKNKQLGERFLRQYSFDNYIVDFYCPKYKLAIELDDEGHFTEQGIECDEKRMKYLNTLGVTVLRFEKFEIFNFPQRTLDEILKCMK